MRVRIEGILLGILFGVLGAWMTMAGLGVIQSNTARFKGTAQVIAGTMFFCAGAWSFFRSTLGPGGQNSLIYHWIEYFMILPILAGLGLIIILAGLESDEFMISLVGILPLAGVLWYAIARFPGRGAKP
jgi:cytochrome bd-type quinol oxidase subunit 2